MLDMSQDALNLTGSIHPLTDDQQHYRRLREAEQQRFEEHANYVNQAYQVRRTNERQQFRERMQKCPIGLPPKRLSPRTPPPDFKLPMPPTHSPHRQWSSLDGQPTMKKSSPDPNLVNSQSNGTIAREALSQQFVPNGNPYRQMNGFGPNFQDPRLQLHHQQQQMHAYYAQQFGAQFVMPNGQAPVPQMQYGHPDLVRLQMLQQQQQWVGSQQQMLPVQFMAQQANVNSTPPPVSTAPQFPPMNRPLAMMDQKAIDPNQTPAQMNGAQFKQQFWAPNQPIMTQQQFGTPTNTQSDNFHPQISNPQLNFIPSTPTHSAESQPKPPSVQNMNGTPIREEPRSKHDSQPARIPPQHMNRYVPNDQSQMEDDILGLYSTIGGDGVDQDIGKYLDNFPNIETYNFAQIGNADIKQH